MDGGAEKDVVPPAINVNAAIELTNLGERLMRGVLPPITCPSRKNYCDSYQLDGCGRVFPFVGQASEIGGHVG